MYLKDLCGIIISTSSQDLQKDTKERKRNSAKFHTTQVSGFQRFLREELYTFSVCNF